MMTSRERNLAIVTLVLLGGLIADWSVRKQYLVLRRSRNAQIEHLTTRIDDARHVIASGEEASRDLEQWKAQALPGNRSLAATVYLDFLQRLFQQSSIDKPAVNPSPPSGVSKNYTTLAFQLSLRCNLDQLDQFLHRFQAAPVLHQVRRLHIVPNVKDGAITDYDVSISIEVLSFGDVRDATHIAGLATESGTPPVAGTFARKKLFQPTKWSDMAAATKPDDGRENIFASARTFEAGVAKVWFTDRKASKHYAVAEGKELTIGPLKIHVVQAAADQIALEIDGQLGHIKMGDNLKSWTPSPNGPASGPIADDAGQPKPQPQPTAQPADSGP